MTDRLEEALGSALERTLAAKDGKAPAPLAESIRYSLLAPGKRIRPRLLLASARMVGLSEEAAYPAAIALEMIHCFTLIHDDLPCMDNSDMRRGRPSNHRKFDEATALLAGDALIASAIEIFSEAAAYSGGKGFARGLKRLSWAMGARGVIGGQAAEPLLGQKSKLDDLLAMHAGKTGALFVASLMIPSDFAEVEPKKAKSLEVFSRQLGAAFQIADDLDDARQESRDGDEGKDPKNILYYLSSDEATRHALEELGTAGEGLGKEWGNSAKELLAISREVIDSFGGQ